MSARPGKQVVAPGDGCAQRLLAGQQRPPAPSGRSKERSNLAAICSIERSDSQAAANSMPKGMPSSRWQMRATAGALSSFRSNVRSADWARATKRRMAS